MSRVTSSTTEQNKIGEVKDVSQQNTVDIASIIDQQKISPFQIRIVMMSFILMLFDGYDISAVAFAAPAISKEWHVARAALGPLFGATLFAGLFGSPLFGYLGDRLGRKTTIIGGTIFFGLFTLASIWATSVQGLIALRFMAGLGISGMIVVVVALNNEFAPRRLRASMVILMFLGITFGGGLAGAVAARYIAVDGWRLLFWIGGLGPILIGLGLIFVLPESIKYLTIRQRKADLVHVLKQIAPGVAIDPNAHFVVGAEKNQAKINPKAMVAGHLAILTPLFWISNACTLAAFYFINQWVPTLLSDAGISIQHASLAITIFQFSGTAAGLIIMRPLDKFGFIPVPILFALSIPIVFFIGQPGLPEWAVMTLIGGAGFCLLGLQFGNIAMQNPMYPTYIRSSAVGTQVLAGRVGGVLGPVIGGILLSRMVPLEQVFHLVTIPLFIGLATTIAITPIYLRKVHRDGQPVEPVVPSSIVELAP
jgi:AAHS family 4-hydroxybenzoate transporter-like MFS transporter